MTAVMSDPLFIRLASILEAERELLQSGRAAEVAALIEDKMIALQDFEGFLSSVSGSSTSLHTRRAIETIAQMAEENAAHMEAVRNGIRHAIARLEGLSSSAQVGSYGRGGAQLSFTNATGAFNRKA